MGGQHSLITSCHEVHISTDAMLKLALLVTLVTLTLAQQHHGHRPGFQSGNPLHKLMLAEVRQIIADNAGVTVEHCADKCDALFEVNAGHDEEMTDKLCQWECAPQLNRPTPTSNSN